MPLILPFCLPQTSPSPILEGEIEGGEKLEKCTRCSQVVYFHHKNKSLEGEDDFDKAALHLKRILTLRLHRLRPEQFIFQSYSSKLIRTPAQSVSSKSTEFYISSWSYQRKCSSSSKILTKTRQNTSAPRWSLLNIRSTVQILNHHVAILKKTSSGQHQ